MPDDTIIFKFLTEDALRAVGYAHLYSRRLNSKYIGPEHLFLGILYQHPGIGSAILHQFRINALSIKNLIKKINKTPSLQDYARRSFDNFAKQALFNTLKRRTKLNQDYIGTEHILLEILYMESSNLYDILEKINIDIVSLRSVASNLLYNSTGKTIYERNKKLFNFTSSETTKTIFLKRSQYSFFKKRGKFRLFRFVKYKPNPILDTFSTNLSEEVKKKYKFKLFGRDQEIHQIVSILAQLKKNSPILLGEPGVGKTTTLEALAQYIDYGIVPFFLENVSIKVLNTDIMISTARFRGEFEANLFRIANEIIKNFNAILVIKDIHKLLDSKKNELSVDISNFLKTTLSQSTFKFIGTSTESEYKKNIGENLDLARYFQTVFINEFDTNTAIQAILRVKSQFEKYHNLTYKNSSIKESVILSDKYIKNKYLPEKAIEILDQAAVKIRLQGKTMSNFLEDKRKFLNIIISKKNLAVFNNDFIDAHRCYLHELKLKNEIKMLTTTLFFSKEKIYPNVTPEIILELIVKKSKIPVTEEKKGVYLKRLLHMEKILHTQIIGQETAVSAVAKAIRRAQSGFRSLDRPIASFIFAGPTGVGKTELTKSLARYLFNSEENLLRFDMSEFQEKYAIARLIGAPPGYVGHDEGGQLTDAIYDKPYSVILFDEVEKGHPDIYDLLLQLLDDGRLTDSKGKVVDFSNTVIILTTNLGAKILEENRVTQPIKLKEFPEKNWTPNSSLEEESFLKSRTLVLDEIKKYFKPEFINRLDDIIIFHHLTIKNAWKICRMLINKIKKELSERNVILNVDLAAQSFLTQKGYNPSYGARPLRRIVTKEIEDALSKRFLIGDLASGVTINITRTVKKSKNIDLLKIYVNEMENKTLLAPYLIAKVENLNK
uniref:ATP-dependent clp protease ATP-binding subunit n=1 Tax=Nitzschia sp. NIES-3576 TaxID=2083273 RepID=A0A2Z5ZAW4_9STRA|nr:ATP-dependent clp protease ATP-binding subunit [Nitzschia sp. NIES-3576]BBC77662.1 ATP-dependent clp protease ATP-binding subunit [Nitzschia sp. NIES-3576]